VSSAHANPHSQVTKVTWLPHTVIPSLVIRWMAHDPSSPPKFLVPETGHQKLVSKLCTPDTRNWYQKHGISNISGMDQDMNKRRRELSTTIPHMFDQKRWGELFITTKFGCLISTHIQDHHCAYHVGQCCPTFLTLRAVLFQL